MIEPLIIFIAQLLYVPVLTMRTILAVKGLKKQASSIGIMEALIYVVAIGLVFSDLNNYLNMAAYVLGFAIGIYIGGTIEEKLAIGFVTIEANIARENEELLQHLRETGFSISTSKVEGMNSIRNLLHCTARRDRETEFYNIVTNYEPNAFVASYELKNFKGGYITKVVKNKYNRHFKRSKSQEEVKGEG